MTGGLGRRQNVNALQFVSDKVTLGPDTNVLSPDLVNFVVFSLGFKLFLRFL